LDKCCPKYNQFPEQIIQQIAAKRNIFEHKSERKTAELTNAVQNNFNKNLFWTRVEIDNK